MKVLVFEDNLMWSSKMMQSLRGLGHEAILLREAPAEGLEAGAAIVNLSHARPSAAEIVAALQRNGTPVIAHAGHKDKQMLDQGRSLGVDILATNGELTFKIGDLLNSLPIKS